MPMQVSYPIDSADAIQAWLNDHGVHACAEPLPHDLTGELPITLVQSIGGSRTVRILDRHAVRLYTWAESYEDAMAECGRALAVLETAEGNRIGDVPCYRVAPTSLPYPAHDPSHPDIPRVGTTLDVYARAVTTEQ